MNEDPHAPHRAALRRDGWRLTPWMLGVYVGRSGELPPACPYLAPGDVAAYLQGIEEGLRHSSNNT